MSWLTLLIPLLGVGLGACGDPKTDSGAAAPDADGDGHAPYSAYGDDCDDGDPSVYGGADEHCDGRDEDCDLRVDEDPVDGSSLYEDGDGDGYGGLALGGEDACQAGEGQALVGGDCDDADPRVSPGATEEGFNQVDDDCDPGTADVCGESAPTATALGLEALDSYDFGGGVVSPAVRLTVEFEDPDGDVGTGALLALWWGAIEAGGADTSAAPDYELGGGAPSSGCSTRTYRNTVNLQVGGILSADQAYGFAARLTDKGGAVSDIAAAEITTPPP